MRMYSTGRRRQWGAFGCGWLCEASGAFNVRNLLTCSGISCIFLVLSLDSWLYVHWLVQILVKCSGESHPSEHHFYCFAHGFSTRAIRECKFKCPEYFYTPTRYNAPTITIYESKKRQEKRVAQYASTFKRSETTVTNCKILRLPR